MFEVEVEVPLRLNDDPIGLPQLPSNLLGRRLKDEKIRRNGTG